MAIIVLVGEQGSGKGTVSAYLEKKYGAQNFRSSAALTDILERIDIPTERKNIIALVTALRSLFGEDVLARALSHHVQSAGDSLCVIEGIRKPQEITLLQKLPDFHLWYVTAPIEMRFEKIKNRGEKSNEGQLTFEEFQSTEQKAVTEIHIPEIAKGAETILKNTGTLEELYAQVDAAMTTLKK